MRYGDTGIFANLDASPFCLVLTATLVTSISFAITIVTLPFTFIDGMRWVSRRERLGSKILVSILSTLGVCLMVYAIISLGIF